MVVVDSAEHRALARQMATRGAVLLRNKPIKAPTAPAAAQPAAAPPAATATGASSARTLPLPRSGRIAIVGPQANRSESLLGNYPGCTFNDNGKQVMDPTCTLLTPLDGLRAFASAAWRSADGNGSVLDDLGASALERPSRDPSEIGADALEIAYARGCEIDSNDTSGIAEAEALAVGADAVVVALGLTTCIGNHAEPQCQVDALELPSDRYLIAI